MECGSVYLAVVEGVPPGGGAVELTVAVLGVEMLGVEMLVCCAEAREG